MAAPTPYSRFRSFQNEQALAPTAPLNGAAVDEEYNRLKITTDTLIAALADIRRDDGALRNGVVTRDALAPNLTVGFGAPRLWQAGLAFNQGDTTFHAGIFYFSNVAHVASVANRPDVDPATWTVIADFTSATFVLTPGSVTNEFLAPMPEGTVKGRPAGSGTGEPQNLNALEARTALAVPPNTRQIAAGAALAGGGDLSADRTLSLALPVGQCRLALDGTNLRLSRRNGRWLMIGGVLREIPATGPTLSTSGLAADTTYYIYAEWTGSAIALLASTTAPATDATTGLRVSSLNSLVTLVGMARTTAATAWADTGSQRFVRSWFNDPGISLQGTLSTNRTTTSTTNVEINTEIRINFLIWAGETIVLQMSGGAVRNSANGGGVHTLFAIDGTTAEPLGGCYFANPTGQTGAQGALSGVRTRATLSEGFHFATLVGRVNTGTATWEGGSDIGVHLSAVTTSR